MFQTTIGKMGNPKDSYSNFFTYFSVSSALQDVIDAIVSLELTAADIQANASTYFDVETGGVIYTISNSSLTLSGIIDCPDGSVSNDGVCGKNKLCLSRLLVNGPLALRIPASKRGQTTSVHS